MSERYEVTVTSRAYDELESICQFIAERSPGASASVAKRLIQAIDALSLLPHRHRVHIHRRDARKTVHAMPVRPFIVYYRVREEESVVEVLCVRHGRRRQPKRFE